MAKKIKIGNLEKYKWEFLRRNDKYNEAYSEYKQGLLEKEEFKSWGLNQPLNPAKRYEEVIKSTRNNKLFFPFHLSLQLDSAYDKACPLVWGELLMDVSLPKKTILEEFEKQLDRLIKSYKGKRGLYEKDPANRRARIARYEHYLNVYDLRVKGWTWRRLAEKFYPGEFIYRAKKYAKRDYQRCKKMIEGGFGQIA